MKVLLVEDDDRVRAALRLGLEEEGYIVSEAASAERALDVLSEASIDVVLVDLMLGRMSGFDLIREIRRARDLPIIVVSARDDTHDVVAGLEAGADDYVTKPVQLKELSARLRASLRRAHRPTTDPDETGSGDRVVLDGRDERRPLVLETASARLMRGDVEVHLTLTEFRLLSALAEDAGHVLSRVQLLQRVWDHGYFGDERLVDVHIRRLRTKVEANPGEPAVIVTVRGLGYRLDRQ